MDQTTREVEYTKYVTICQSIVDGSGIMGTEWGKA